MMADVYTAMISPREYRPGLAPDKVAKEVFIKRGQYVNSAVSSMFIKTFGIYPPGTVIKLKTGETAVATRTTKDPQRPELSIISDKNQQPISPPKPIDGEYAIDSALRPALNNSHIDTPSLWNLNSPQDDDTQPQQTTDEALDSMQGPSPEELKRAYEAIKGVEIPPIPQTIFDLRAEISKEEPDMDKIAELVSTEIVLSGIVMKTVNSPLFGLASKVTSIKHAMMVMGIKRFNDLVLASALKKAIGGEDDDPRMHQFWAESSAVGHCASRIASLVEDADREEAYMAGLFQACGSLFLAKKFPDYSDTMLPRAFISPFSVISEENKVYGTNHATVSFLMAKHWQLPVSTCLSIYHHHTQPLSKLNDDKVRAFAAILALSTMIVEWVCFAKHEETAERVAYREQAISELYISEAEVEEIQLDITDMLLKEIES
jgi:HD-like signal output (HDOD) protein